MKKNWIDEIMKKNLVFSGGGKGYGKTYAMDKAAWQATSVAIYGKDKDGNMVIVSQSAEFEIIEPKQINMEKLTDSSKMPWGHAWKDRALIDVPADYLIWAYENKLKALPENLKEYIKNNWDVLKSQAKQKK